MKRRIGMGKVMRLARDEGGAELERRLEKLADAAQRQERLIDEEKNRHG